MKSLLSAMLLIQLGFAERSTTLNMDGDIITYDLVEQSCKIFRERNGRAGISTQSKGLALEVCLDLGLEDGDVVSFGYESMSDSGYKDWEQCTKLSTGEVVDISFCAY